ncbi:MAG: DNA cytosine methyltransferase [Pirellulaceae bacterium]
MKPTAIDLFSGCGGLTAGLRKAGFQVLAGVEMESSACAVYQLNHPETHLFDKDITSLSVATVKRKLGIQKGQLDLLAGCPPCQGFSTVRTLNGKREIIDERNDLIFQFLRLVKGLGPKAVMLENVPGLAEDLRLKLFVDDLNSLGYSVQFRVLNVADYGVPQRRHRVVLLAGKAGPIPFAPKAKRTVTVRDAIENLPPAGRSGDAVHDLPENRTDRIRKLISSIPKNGGSRNDLPRNLQLECHKRCDGFKDVYGRMAWDEVAPTLTTGCFNPSKGRFLHPEEDRTITIREAALLQTFPRRYKFLPKLGKVTLATQIGNALPPEFVKRQAIVVRKYLKDNSTTSRVVRRGIRD